MGSYHFASGRHVLSRAWQLPTFAPAGMWSTTSMRVRERHWPEVTRALWGEHFWSPSYCVVSAGGAPLAIVKRYIETQQSPNRQGRTSRSGRPRPRPHGRGLRSPSVQSDHTLASRGEREDHGFSPPSITGMPRPVRAPAYPWRVRADLGEQISKVSSRPA